VLDLPKNPAQAFFFILFYFIDILPGILAKRVLKDHSNGPDMNSKRGPIPRVRVYRRIRENSRTAKTNKGQRKEIKSMKNRILMAILPVLACFALLPGAQAGLNPAPDGCYPNYTTAEGCNALNLLTTGAGNTGLGWYSLFSTTTGSFNTGVGGGALALNNGDSNTAVGAAALLLNTTGSSNTAVGTDTLVFNDSGPFNTAVGFEALMNATHNANAAFGDLALQNVTTGFFNTAIGAAAGVNQTTGHNNIYIGQGSFGVAGESNTCYIQEIAGASIPTANANFVFVDNTTGQLGTVLVDADGNRVTVPIPQRQLQAAPQGQPKAVPRHYSEDGRQAMLNLKVQNLQATVAQQQKQIEALTAGLQKVSAQLEVSKPAAKVVVNKP
jgi:hypothetical protein